MKLSNNALPLCAHGRTAWWRVALLTCALVVTACGGGAPNTDPAQTVAQCVSGDAATSGECGTLLLGLTDADGDFLSYTVDVVSLELERSNGAVVEVLPRSTRVDFASYVDLTEFVSASTVPPGTYVAGRIALDYSAAEVFVEADGVARQATVVDLDGNPIQRSEIRVVLANRDQLLITRGMASLLTVDFDLAASHTVDIAPTPAIATAEPFIVAEIDPVDSKEVRVRGAYLSASETEKTYAIQLRPFFDRVGDFGRVTVHVTDETEFEVDGETWLGVEGLRALNAAGSGTWTVAQGTLDVAAREFTAALVLAGSSVPGIDRDAVRGNVIARDGNELIVRGATVIPRDAAAFFHDDVVVTVGPDTKVFKSGAPDLPLTASDISIGQRVTVRGVVADLASERIVLDATEGAVRMSPTHLSGIVQSINPGQLDIELHAIDRRRGGIFDFSGTGISPVFDADPDRYEVLTGELTVSGQATGKPVVVYGYPRAFGTAPADFEGRTLVDFSDVRSVLGVGWGQGGTHVPFLSIGGDGLLVDNFNPDIELRHHIKQGPILIDLTTLDSSTLMVPNETGRTVFTLATRGSLHQYVDFAEFVEALTLELDGATAARSMHARGHYDAATNVFTAYRIGVYLLEP
ncbi:MAG: DUF4382 domain-containing protein [Woeseiaceae bacterium]